MSKALDSGKSLLDTVLAKLPESLREGAAKAFAAPEAADALTLLGDSALARADYSKSMDAITAKEAALTEDYEKLNQWFAENKATLEKAGTLEAEIARLKAGGIVPPKKDDEKPAGLTAEDIQKQLDARDQGYAAVLGLSTTLATKHLRDFNEVLDLSELIGLANQKKIGLADAYTQKYADKISAKAKAEEDTRIQKRVDELLVEEKKKLVGSNHFPLVNASPSALDIAVESKDKNSSAFGVDAAVAEYQRLQEARG